MKLKDLITYIGVAALIAVLLFIVLPAGCTRPRKAIQVLENAGYTDIEITGWRPFMKSDNEVFSTGFRAKAQNGNEVTGAVTSGWIKGNTIRLD